MRVMVVLFKVRCLEPWIKYKTVYSCEEAASATMQCLSTYNASEVKVIPQNRYYVLNGGRSSVGYAMQSLAMSLQ